MPVHPLVVVADTTPLLYLAKLDLLNLLRDLFARVVIPSVVWTELVDARPDAPGVAVLKAVDWIDIDATADESMLARELARELDAGEAAAIALALARDADLLLIDEHDGRLVAVARGLRIRGTVGVLVTARVRGLIPSLRPTLDALIASGFRLDRALYTDALLSVGEIGT